jgi:deoxycytidylate deaminase
VIVSENPVKILEELQRQARRYSTCPKAAVGAAFYSDNALLISGFNGAPEGMSYTCMAGSCEWMFAEKDGTGRDHARHLHAEMKAVANAARLGISLQETDLVVTQAPCPTCALVLMAVKPRSLWFPMTTEYEGWYQVEREVARAGITVWQINR